jgi:hypothetical protein
VVVEAKLFSPFSVMQPNYPQEYLAKFGCKPYVKIEKIKSPFTFWLPIETYY